ncbi:MAG: filamentous hemagglutinin N-terminal domain-containing protein [Cyanobacteria bacterium P01_F01_bin.143]
MFSLNYKHLYINQGFRLFTSLSLFFILGTKIVQAQITTNIKPDGSTSTTVEPISNQYNIIGGENAGNNIFHSFKEFGLTSGDIANFLSGSDTENIFGRVTGGNISVIDGLLKVTGGTPNLFFINPAGIIFDENSSINVPASFTATTANGIQFGEFWLDALGGNNYDDLVGDPTAFAFIGSNLGGIVNLGNINAGVDVDVLEGLSLNSDGSLINEISDSLAQNTGETINLAGGLVINTGTLKTPGGNINIVAVPEEQLVRITPEGSLLSLVFSTDAEEAKAILQPGIDAAEFTPPSLPDLLNGGGLTEANEIYVREDGVIVLRESDSQLPSDLGTAIASGKIDTSNDNGDGGNINISGEKVGILTGNIDASGNSGGSISVSSEGFGIDEFSDSSRILIDSNSSISATGIGVSETGEDAGTGGEITITGNGAIALDSRLSDSTTSPTIIDVSGINDHGTVEITAKNNIATINSDNALDFYLDNLPSYLNFNAIDSLVLESNSIKIVGENSNLGATAIVKEEINNNNFLTTENFLTETTVIPVDSLTKVENVTIESSNSLTVARDTLVSTGDNDAQFIGSLINPENIDSASNKPLEDIPVFQNLTLRVDPPKDETGSLNIQGSFAVTNDLLLENTNGDIILEPQLPEYINFTSDDISTTSGKDLEYRGNNGSLFIGLESLLSGVEPHGESLYNLGSATINAHKGSVELLKGITLNTDTDFSVRAEQFIGSGKTQLWGNGPNGQPGRTDSDSFETYTIGFVSFGGVSTGGTEDVSTSEDSSPDPEPEIQLVVSFNPDNPTLIQPLPIVLSGEESAEDEGINATGNVEITLLSDESFKVGEFDSETESGIISIARISRISNNGSLVGNISEIEPISSAKDQRINTPNKNLNDILDQYGLELEPEEVFAATVSSMTNNNTSSNEQSQQQLVESNDETDSENNNSALEIGIDVSSSIAALGMEATSDSSDGMDSSNNDSWQTDVNNEATGNSVNSTSEIASQTDNSSAARRGTSSDNNSQTTSTTSSSSSSSNETGSNSNSGTDNSNNVTNQANSSASNQTSSNVASEANSNATNSDAASESSSNSSSQANSDAASESSSNSSSQADSDSANESSSDSSSQANSDAASESSSNSSSQANSNTASESSSNSSSQANSNAASESSSNSSSQANSNAASESSSNSSSQANSDAASESNSSASSQANSNAVSAPVSGTAPLPEKNFDPLSGLQDDSKVSLLQEEPEVKPDSNPIKDLAIPIAGGLLLTTGVGAVIANALLGNTLASTLSNSLSSTLSNLLNSAGSNPTPKPEPNNTNSKSEQNNTQQDTEIEMEATMEPGIMQLSEFPILDFEIALEMEADPGTQTIHIKDNFVNHDQVEVKSE